MRGWWLALLRLCLSCLVVAGGIFCYEQLSGRPVTVLAAVSMPAPKASLPHPQAAAAPAARPVAAPARPPVRSLPDGTAQPRAAGTEVAAPPPARVSPAPLPPARIGAAPELVQPGAAPDTPLADAVAPGRVFAATSGATASPVPGQGTGQPELAAPAAAPDASPAQAASLLGAPQDQSALPAVPEAFVPVSVASAPELASLTTLPGAGISLPVPAVGPHRGWLDLSPPVVLDPEPASAPQVAPAPPPLKADLIVVAKADRRLTLYQDGRVIRQYRVSLGFNPDGHKQKQGDGRTPEGRYTISGRNPHSVAHLSLRVSYPNAADKARARAAGVDPGGDIMIHGILNGWGWLGSLHLLRDWTQGCIAVTDAEIREIWALVPDGTPIHIE